MQPFTTKFTLTRDYLAECFDQSQPYGKSSKKSYLFAAALLAGGAGLLLYSEHPKVVGYMLVALAVLELIHIRYRRAWWLTRQAWGRSCGSEVKLTVDEDGVCAENPYTQSKLSWADVERVIETDLGLILVTKSGGQQYLSKSLFPAELINDIVSRK